MGRFNLSARRNPEYKALVALAAHKAGGECHVIPVVPGEDGIYRVDEAAVIADGKLGDIEGYRGFAMMMNSDLAETRSPNRATSPSHGVMGVEEFTRCTIGNAIGVGILNTPGLIKGTVAAVKAWNWGLAAKTILRIAGPIALKGAGGLPVWLLSWE